MKLVNEIAEEQTTNPNSICMSCLNEESENYDVIIELTETQNLNEFIYIITDPESDFSENPFSLSFGARYDFKNCETTEVCFDEL